MRKLLLSGLLSINLLQAAPDADDSVLFYGNSMVERLLENGQLEARLQLTRKKRNQPALSIRSLAWTGDEVGYRLRPEGYVRHLTKVLDEWKSNTIILGFGLNEAFHGQEGLKDFKAQYSSYLKQLSAIHPKARFILLSPIALEEEQFPVIKEKGEACVVNCQCLNKEELSKHLELYSEAIKQIATEHKMKFVDAYSPSKKAYAASEIPLTTNGIHLNDLGNNILAKALADQITGTDTKSLDSNRLDQVAQAASQKHGYVAEIARPKNSVVYFGVRQRPDEYKAEIPRYFQLVDQSDKVIEKLLASPTLKFSAIDKPSLPPMAPVKGKGGRKGTGIIKSPAEAMAEFKVADDYEVTLFASEEEFPELRNPVQIAFDAKGRLWVVTMPSFPHTVPGLPQEDKILILEDTDNDGKADKSTVYADGFDALDGITFHHKGPIISAQPRHLLAPDENGDDRADSLQELLRGIDMTDSHHGGMLSADPYGGIVFSDGVFLRSQLETPFGVHRGIDATTYRHNLNTGEVRTEWQSAIPNPWQPTFDRWGNNYQMYGDGIVVDSLMLTWTPLGVYHPFKHGQILGYGKGSAAALISSENFPQDYQNGIASASLLGNYTVSISQTSFDDGKIKVTEKLDLVSSPNAAFRPAAVAFGMDGGLYISDFCSPIIGHAQHKMRDPNWDHQHGRIWRVINKKNPINTKFPTIAGASPQDLCKLLKSTNDLVRNHARIELRKHGEAGLKALESWVASLDKDNPSYDEAILEAIFTAEGLGKTYSHLIDTLLVSKSPLMRAAAIHTIRLQANRLPTPTNQIKSVLSDPHPRVQMAVVDAIAHMQKELPAIIDLAKEISPKNKVIKQMLKDLEHGTAAHKARSIPVLSVSPKAHVRFWNYSDPSGKQDPTTFDNSKTSTFTDGSYRTFIHSNTEQPAILSTVFNYIDVSVNGTLLLSDNERWSKDQQVSMSLKKGINVIDVKIKDGKKAGKQKIYIYDLIGEALTDATYSNTKASLDKLNQAYQKDQEKFAGAIRIQAVPHQMKFSPTEFRVKAGSDVRLIFQNPDSMLHNLIILAPGSKEKIGALADKMAGDPDAIKKAYVPDSKEVLHASKLVNPNQTEELKFKAPTTPGSYPFLCTFPGHWTVMQGVMIVE
ncbi:MAG: DUF7133 domain-containing protein [Akkermansiaceae bacterium]